MSDNQTLFGTMPSSISIDVIDTLPIPLVSFSISLEAIYFNTAFAKYIALDGEKVAHLTDFGTLHASDIMPEYQPDGQNSAEIFLEYARLAVKKGSCSFPFVVHSANDKDIPTQISMVAVDDKRKKYINCYFLHTIDSTKESTRAMLDACPIAITLWDSNFNLRDANAHCVKLFGFKDQGDFLKHYRKSLPVQTKGKEVGSPDLELALTTGFKDGYNRLDLGLKHMKEDELVPVRATFVRLNLWNEELVVASFRDLRQMNAIIDEMHFTEERIQTIFDITPLGINVWDHSFNVIDCNEAIVKMYGFKNKEAYLSARYKIFPRVQPDGTRTLTIAQKIIQEAFEKGHSQVEYLTYDVSGNPIPVETVFKRARVREEDVVISFVRDLRDLKAKLAEIDAAQQELRTARDLAEQSAQSKSVFLGNMSHEIRTPLNGVVGLLHVLNSTALQPVQKDFVDKAISSADNLLRVLNDILDFSKIDTGTFEMQRNPFTLQEVMDEVRLVFEPQALSKGVALNIFMDNTCEEILYGDGARLKQVFFNLMNNAINFTKEGQISINASCTSHENGAMHYLFSVQDTGEGMTKAQSLKVFSAFTQADSSITRKHGGSGLGLTIAKNIIKLMNGDMWVKTQKGEGSTFFFNAIFKNRTRDKNAPQAQSQEMGIDALAQEQAPAQIPAQSTVQAPVQPAVPFAGNILLVEDNEISQLITAELLKNKGYIVDIACNGKEAVDMVKQGNYQLVLMDIQMPVMDGLTATSKIRDMKRFADLPIVAMSAHAMVGDKAISMEHGMNDHLAKPTLPAVLFEAVEKWIKK